MIGIDTNVLVRYITQDDQQQSKKANQFIENQLTKNESVKLFYANWLGFYLKPMVMRNRK